MQYINPFELLDITTTNPSNMDGVTVNKAKRKLLAEIDLSDTNTIQYKGIELSKSDCIRITDDLDNKDKYEFHLFILQDKYLNEFLCKGSLLFFDNFRFEYIYKQSEFLDFISPYFSEKYDNLLFENFKRKNLTNVLRLLLVKPITNEAYYDSCFKSTYALVRNVNEDLEKIYEDIKNKLSQYIENNFISLPKVVIDRVDVPLINTLPAYFQSLRNQLAQTIRDISTEINNDPFSLFEPAFKIIEISNSIFSDGLVKQNVIKAHAIIKKNYESELENIKKKEKETKQYNADLELHKDKITSYEAILQQIDVIISQIIRKQGNYVKNRFSGLDKWLELTIDIPTLNSQPQIFDNIRKRIAFALKQLSVIIWNDYENIESSFNIIQLAIAIKVDAETRTNIKINYDTLKLNAEKRKKYGKPISSAPDLDNYLIFGYNLYGNTRYFTILMIPILPLNRYSVKSDSIKDYVFSKSKLHFYGELELKLWQKIWKYGSIVGLIVLFFFAVAILKNPSSNNLSNEAYKSPSNSYSTSNSNNLTLPNPPPPPKFSNNYFPSAELAKPVYSYPYMSNGNITGCTTMGPLYDQNIDNKLIISCGNNADVAVKLIDYEKNQTIRYVYIHKNTTFTLTKIPEGKYYLKIAYGEKWGIAAGESNCKGRFTESSLCKKGTEILDYNIIHYSDGRYQVPSFSLSLNVVFIKDDNSNNFDTDKIPENDFYNE
jgi:hypothetical protein